MHAVGSPRSMKKMSESRSHSFVDQPSSNIDEDPEHVDNIAAQPATSRHKRTSNTWTILVVDIEPNAEHVTKEAAATGMSAREDREDSGRKGACSKRIGQIQDAIHGFLQKNSTVLWRLFYGLLLLLYLVYVVAALIYKFGDEGSISLLVMTLMMLTYLLFRLVKQSTVIRSWKPPDESTATVSKFLNPIRLEFILAIALTMFLIIYILVAVARFYPRNLVSLGGMVVFVLLSYVFSYNPARVNWRPVVRGILLQFILAMLILRTEWGWETFVFLANRITEFLSFADAGSKYVFGNMFMDHFFVFKVMPVLVFFSACVKTAYYVGLMQFTVYNVGHGLAFCLGTSPTESLIAVANIFLGAGEACLLVRPFLDYMTKSELHTVMVGGFATIAGGVMAAYIVYGVPAHHLLSASVMSAPAALAVSKLLYPETKKVEDTKERVVDMAKGSERNIIEAAAKGASESIELVANIVVNLVALVSLLGFLNTMLSWFGDRVGLHNPELTFQMISSYLFFPLAFLMGVAAEDCLKFGNLIGTKIFLNEFIAYLDLAKYMNNRKMLNEYIHNSTINSTTHPTGFWDYKKGGIYLKDIDMFLEKGLISERSVVVATYALCGFSNIATMGMMLVSLGAMAPTRRSDLAELVFRAMIGGNVACFMTACIAGVLTT